MEHFKSKLIGYLDYYYNRKIKAKGPDSCATQNPGPYGYLIYNLVKLLGALHIKWNPICWKNGL